MTTLEPGETKHQIENTTQLTFETLRIGTGNFWIEEYTTEAGDTAEGPTAGLWLYFRDTPDQDTKLRVYPGMVIEQGGYRIRVLEIGPETDDSRGYVQLGIQKLE